MVDRDRITVVALVLTLAWGGTAAAQINNADEICPPSANPCIVQGAIKVAAGASLDFGGRAVIVSNAASLDAGSNFMTLTCGSLRIESSGKILSKGGTTTSGGDVTITTVTTLTVIGQIDVSGTSGGSLTIDAGGPIDIASGRLIADATSSIGAGGQVYLTTANGLKVGGPVSATGGSGDGGGGISVDAAQTIDITSSLDVSAGESGAGQIDITGGGRVTVATAGRVRANSSTAGGGGSITIAGGVAEPGSASGGLTIAGIISATGGNNLDGGGDGGTIELTASLDCQLSGTVTATSGSPGGSGGSIQIDCGGSSTLGGQLDASGVGAESGGGAIGVAGTDQLVISGRLFAKGGTNADGGEITVQGDDLQFAGTAAVRVDTSGTGSGGTIAIDAVSALSFAGDGSAAGGNSLDGGGFGGTITLATDGNCRIAGAVTAMSGSPGGTGGAITVSAGTAPIHEIVVSGEINASGTGSESDGGGVTIDGAGAVIIQGRVFAKGASASGGDIEVTAGETLTVSTTGSVRADGGTGGGGGTIVLSADGDFTTEGTVASTGGSTAGAGGDGGTLTLAASNCQVEGEVTVVGGTPDGSGGSITVTCGQTADHTTVIATDLSARAPGSRGIGGSIGISATGAVQVDGKLDSRGGTGGGSVTLDATGSITVANAIRTGGSNNGGTVSMSSIGGGVTFTATGVISADAATSTAAGGTVDISGCRVNLPTQTSATALGRLGAIAITGINRVDLGGTITTDEATGSINLVVRDTAPNIDSSARIVPLPRVLINAALPGCNAPPPTPTGPTLTPTATPSGSRPPTPTPTATRSPTPRPTPAGDGDANCDGRIDSDDLTGITEGLFDPMVRGLCPFVDVNEDGVVSAADYPALMKILTAPASPDS